MKLARYDNDLFISDFIDKAVLVRDTVGPITFEVASKQFGLSNSGEWCFGGFRDETTHAFEHFLSLVAHSLYCSNANV